MYPEPTNAVQLPLITRAYALEADNHWEGARGASSSGQVQEVGHAGHS